MPAENITEFEDEFHELWSDPDEMALAAQELRQAPDVFLKHRCLLFIVSAVGALCCLHSTSGVALEVLPQPRARGKAFRTCFAPFFQFC